MKCPHCQVEFHDNPTNNALGRDIQAFWYVDARTCPSCNRFIFELTSRTIVGQYPGEISSRAFIRPRSATRPSPPSDVPAEIAQDYIEASLVLSDSPKASAALSRRCLQHLLRDKANVKKADLANEIEEVISSRALPSHLSEAIDAIRNIGNFAAHPVKSSASGEILPVEPGEAEWTLDVLDGLFDFYFVQPALLKSKRDALNLKLASANKPAIKG